MKAALGNSPIDRHGKVEWTVFDGTNNQGKAREVSSLVLRGLNEVETCTGGLIVLEWAVADGMGWIKVKLAERFR